MKKIIAILLVMVFVSGINAFAVSKNEPFKNLGKGIDNICYGAVEVPDNLNETGSKGEKAFKDTTDDTKSDAGRGITRIVGGLWQLATFWYPTE